jgi:methionyl-tRNA formyltransferase
MYNVYESIYVLGQGATPFRCAQLLHNLGVKCIFLEDIQEKISFVEKNIRSINIPYFVFDKFILDKILAKNHKTLILSVNNKFLFSQEIVDCKNIDIINYHNSLLPKHRGMHAEAWTIYENDTHTGITWHLVDDGIDTGDIIIQRTIHINDEITSISLLRKQSQIAISALYDCLYDILSGKLKYHHQDITQQEQVHLKNKIPNNGELCRDWSYKQIWSFLRAMDYGCLYTLGYPRIYYSGKWYGWHSYCKLSYQDRKYCIYKSGKSIILNNSFLLNNIFEIE